MVTQKTDNVNSSISRHINIIEGEAPKVGVDIRQLIVVSLMTLAYLFMFLSKLVDGQIVVRVVDSVPLILLVIGIMITPFFKLEVMLLKRCKHG